MNLRDKENPWGKGEETVPAYVIRYALAQSALEKCTQYNATVARAYPQLYFMGAQGAALLAREKESTPSVLTLQRLLEDMLLCNARQCDMRTAYIMGYAVHLVTDEYVQPLVPAKTEDQRALRLWALDQWLKNQISAGKLSLKYNLSPKIDAAAEKELYTMLDILSGQNEKQTAKENKKHCRSVLEYISNPEQKKLPEYGIDQSEYEKNAALNKCARSGAEVQRQMRIASEKGKAAIDAVTFCARGEQSVLKTLKYFKKEV